MINLYWIIIKCICILTSIPLSEPMLQETTADKNSSKFVHHSWELELTSEGSVEITCADSTTENSNSVRYKRSGIQTFERTTEPAIATVDMSRFSIEFLSCPKTEVEPQCYQMLNNGSVYIPIYDMIFNNSDYFLDDDNILFICPHFFPNTTTDSPPSKFSEALDIISIVGIVISTVCIILHIAMFVLIRKLRNLPGYCLISLCVALLIGYASFIIPLALPENSDCSAFGMVMFYFFLASFFWMNAMSYDVWRSLRMATSKLRLTADRSMMIRFALYSLYSWGVPLLIVIITFILDFVGTDPKYKLTFNARTCWLRYKQALLIYFAMPLFILLFVNILFYISSFCMIHNATMNTAENRADLSSRFFISMRLAVVMGLMWIFGVLAAATNHAVLWFLYAICNTLQGVFIFFSFTLTGKTRKACIKAIQKRKCSVLPTQTSSQQITSL